MVGEEFRGPLFWVEWWIVAWKPLQGNLYRVDIFSQSNSLLYLMERSEKEGFWIVTREGFYERSFIYRGLERWLMRIANKRYYRGYFQFSRTYYRNTIYRWKWVLEESERWSLTIRNYESTKKDLIYNKERTFWFISLFIKMTRKKKQLDIKTNRQFPWSLFDQLIKIKNN